MFKQTIMKTGFSSPHKKYVNILALGHVFRYTENIMKGRPVLDAGYLITRIASGAKGGAAAIHSAFGGESAFRTTLHEIQDIDTYSVRPRLVKEFASSVSCSHSLKDAFNRFLSGWTQRNRQSLPDIAADLMESLGMKRHDIVTGDGLSAEEHALARAMMLVAARAEMIRGKAPTPLISRTENKYHNTLHTASLPLVSAAFLRSHDRLEPSGAIEPMDLADRLEIFLSGFAHDIDHDGRPNPPDQPFRNEQRSCAAILPILDACGVPASRQSSILATILATSPNGGIQFLKKIGETLKAGKSADIASVDPEGKYPALHTLLEKPKNFYKAALVEDADLFNSAAAGDRVWKIMADRLTEEQRLLGIETANFGTLPSRLFFLNMLVGPQGFTSPGAEALCNGEIDHCRAETHRKVDAANPAPP